MIIDGEVALVTEKEWIQQLADAAADAVVDAADAADAKKKVLT